MRCAVLGDPVAHSLSPVLHRAGYAATGLDWTYEAHRVPAGGLASFLAGLDESWRGLSLTMPLKREALAQGTLRTDRAELAGAANTLVLSGGGALADNTDIPGAVAALRERYDGPVGRAVVLGGGATAASTALALCDLGAREVTLLVRSPGRATETAVAVRRHASAPEVRVVAFDSADAPAGEVVVSTIPAGAQPPLLDRVLGTAGLAVVFEVLYHPWPTPLAAAALDDGRVLVGGLDLLVHQAAVQFTAFTGVDAPVAAMRAAGEAELARRAGGTAEGR